MGEYDEPPPDGVNSLLDTDLYKLTMQCAILKYFPDVQVAYSFTNRTPHMKLTRGANAWLEDHVRKLGNIKVTEAEIAWLEKTCPYLSKEYLQYLKKFKLRPSAHVKLNFTPVEAVAGHDIKGDLSIEVRGLWVETILYEIPLLALVSEAYFKFVDRDWNHEGQMIRSMDKGMKLLQNGCVFSEFGSRRRRDYKTHELVIDGLVRATQRGAEAGYTGKFTGTSNVHFAMKFGIQPIGTVAHEWFMGIAAITEDYANANEIALQYWTGTFGRGVLAIALTDTFGTPAFLEAFKKPAPKSKTVKDIDGEKDPTYAQIFTGVRQDSGDPLEYMKLIKEFYTSQGITDKKVIVFSDSLNVDKCINYKEATEVAGLSPSFGVGTHFTNDFFQSSHITEKSVPLNIVIKLSEANGRPAIKLSDNKGKNTGDDDLVKKVKDLVGYQEKSWGEGDEAHRWDGTSN